MTAQILDLDLDQLTEIAEAASPGPWEWLPAHLGTKELVSLAKVRGEDGEMVDPDPDELEFLTFTTIDRGGFETPVPADQAFIAAANPAVVLELVARIRRLEGRVGNLEGRLASASRIRSIEGR